jgi:hypothetical protein
VRANALHLSGGERFCGWPAICVITGGIEADVVRKPSLLTLTVVVLMTAMILLNGHHNPALPPESVPQTPARHINPLRPMKPRTQLAWQVPHTPASPVTHAA